MKMKKNQSLQKNQVFLSSNDQDNGELNDAAKSLDHEIKKDEDIDFTFIPNEETTLQN